MQIQLVCVGKIKEKFLQAGIDEYLKRLSCYAKVQIVEVPDEKTPDNASAAEEEQIRAKEGEKLLRQIKAGSYVIALAIEGRNLSSEELAKTIADLALQGKSDVTLVIGGSLGLASEVLQRADYKLSFGKMTFPHQLMRMMLLEQVYRGFRINRGEPYHK